MSSLPPGSTSCWTCPEDSLQFLRAGRVRKLSSWGRLHHGLSLTTPVIRNLAFNLEPVLGLALNNDNTWLWRTPAWTYPVQMSRPMLTGSANQPPDWLLIGSTWWYQKLKVRANSRLSCLALAEKIWTDPQTQFCCSSYKCMFHLKGNKQTLVLDWLIQQRNNLPNTHLLTAGLGVDDVLVWLEVWRSGIMTYCRGVYLVTQCGSSLCGLLFRTFICLLLGWYFGF